MDPVLHRLIRAVDRRYGRQRLIESTGIPSSTASDLCRAEVGSITYRAHDSDAVYRERLRLAFPDLFEGFVGRIVRDDDEQREEEKRRLTPLPAELSFPASSASQAPTPKGRAHPGHLHLETRGNVLVIGDTHWPFTHRHYLEHCKRTRDQWKCDVVVHIGDEADNHALSYHEHDPDGYSAGHEFERALVMARDWYEAFPEVTVLVGNHGALPFRKAFTAGISRRFLRTYEEMWEAPAGWVWTTSLETQGVYFTHGLGGGGGKNGAINLALKRGQSTVMGHYHTSGGVTYQQSHVRQVFGIYTGCGIDENAYAMAYARDTADRPILGCAVVVAGGRQGHFIPMPV